MRLAPSIRSSLTRFRRAPLPMLMALTALIAMTASTSLAGSGAGGGAATATSTGSKPPASANGRAGPPGKPAADTKYRIVGCRSDGAGAYRGGPARREVAIGFDDGPAPDTSAFVTMLERSHAQATFFMIGEQLSSGYRPTLLRELRDGDVLGDHTYTHPDLTLTRDVRGQLEQTIAAIHDLSGYTPCVFRPPYGYYDARVLSIAGSLGLATVLWNVDPSDYARPGSAAIEQRILAEVRPGSIIISHDGGGPRGQTLAAYPRVISALRARGYRIVTIPQLLGFRPVYIPCIKLCDGIALTRRLLPSDAIIERAA